VGFFIVLNVISSWLRRMTTLMSFNLPWERGWLAGCI